MIVARGFVLDERSLVSGHRGLGLLLELHRGANGMFVVQGAWAGFPHGYWHVAAGFPHVVAAGAARHFPELDAGGAPFATTENLLAGVPLIAWCQGRSVQVARNREQTV